MKLVMLLAAIVALSAPVAALADTTPTPASTANALCKQAQTSMGAALFGQTYGTTADRSNAFGKCVSKNASNAQRDVTNAAATCKAQQADSNFAASHGGKTFDPYYGSNGSKGQGSSANAYGKCVSQAVTNAVKSQSTALTTAAKTCKAALKASATDFAAKYGTGRNAVGKCVSATAKTK
jgi:hypothetical protein